MKTFLSLLALFVFSVGFASAQSTSVPGSSNLPAGNGSDVTGFKSGYQSPAYNSKTPATPPNPNPVLKPKAGGVFVDGVKNGWVMISPAAPASYGMGEKYLAAPSSRADLAHESAYAAHRDTGGIKLLTWEF